MEAASFVCVDPLCVDSLCVDSLCVDSLWLNGSRVGSSDGADYGVLPAMSRFGPTDASISLKMRRYSSVQLDGSVKLCGSTG